MTLCLAVAAAVALAGCVRTTKPAGSTYKPRPAPGVNASYGGSEVVPLPRRKPRVTARVLRQIKPKIPKSVETVSAARPAKPSPAVRPNPDRGRVGSAGIYYVTVRDTLYSISRRFHVPLRSLIDANGLEPPYTLRVGQRLTLPKARTYTVVKGDTVYGISRRHGVDMSELMRLNGIKPPYTISVGQALRVPDPSGRPIVVATASLASNGSAAAAKPTRPAASVASPAPQVPAAEAAPRPVPVAAGTGPVPRPPPRSGSKFLWPVQGKVVSGFGAQGKGYHNDGINILAPRGAEVRAAENGVIAYAGNELRGFGNLVLVKHDGGWTTAYAHTDQILVSRGQTVKRGQMIARVGSSGNVARPQLHFEIRKGARAVDPTRLLGPQDAKL
ncbi:MAG: peptidoglycan DD-metalloendopeptidase family protein [Kiloniellales bacterium]|nr:peptidoglycan DD-metalloendopeptidase family protein [Kiloniellales bacterium]